MSLPYPHGNNLCCYLHPRPSTFCRGVIFPTYGLAEHTVYVCSNGKDRLVVDRVMLETERKVR